MTKIGIYDHSKGGELIVRNMTAEEIAEHEAVQAVFAQEQAAEAQKNQSKAALLERLGITEQEAELLFS